jgi:serine/threonine protein kinase
MYLYMTQTGAGNAMSRKKSKAKTPKSKVKKGKKYEVIEPEPEPLFKPWACGCDGCVYTEDAIPKHCEPAANSVIKIPFYKKSAVSELRDLDIDTIDPDEQFSLHQRKRCEVYVSKYDAGDYFFDSDTFGIIYHNGGKPLSKITVWDGHTIAKLTNIIYGIATMNQAGFYHNDVHPDNIVYDGNAFRLIDWGYASNVNGVGHSAFDYKSLGYLIKGYIENGPDQKVVDGVFATALNSIYPQGALAYYELCRIRWWSINNEERLAAWIALVTKYFPEEEEFLSQWKK